MNLKVEKPGSIFRFYLLAIALFFGCNSNYTVDKKRGFFKIEFPEREYRLFNQQGYPYTFEYPVYANIVRDTTFFEDKPENPWWINIDIPRFAGRIYVSYKEIGKNKLDSLVNDAFTMSYKQHTYKASSIEDSLMRTKSGNTGIYFKLAGNTATANQFFLTDSVRHFLRGALYFDATPNEDSLGIVNDFLKKDLHHLINTLKWR
jgi:gliding motility-associated lipoprotein GldD